MATRAYLALTLSFAGLAFVSAAAFSQANPAPKPAAGQACTVDSKAPSETDPALKISIPAERLPLYQAQLAADPNSSIAKAGLVRATLDQGKLDDALATAIKFDAAKPDDPLLLDALAAVRFRRGETTEAATTLNKSLRLNPCLGQTHFQMSRYLALNGMYASAQKQLEIAHTLSPADPTFTRLWKASHAVPPTEAERLAKMKAELNDPKLTDDKKEGINAAIKGIEANERGDCRLVSPIPEATLAIVPSTRGEEIQPDGLAVAGLDVAFNGKKRRLMIDTGGSGILLSRTVAKAAGLVPEWEVKEEGFGDSGPVGAYVTHVDDIRIGAMEFKNCIVQVLEQNDVLDVDGLIGTDVFKDYLVTLDVPQRQLRLGPLPPRPNESTPPPPSLAPDSNETVAGARPLSEADRARDRYVAPEMKDWTQVFRYGHYLIVPTQIGAAPKKLFLIDTGSTRGMITAAAAREVTVVATDFDRRVTGVSGQVQNVMAAGDVTITFCGVRQTAKGLSAFDSSFLSLDAGVEISGLIGFPTLRELVITIDYRDNLIKVVFDPKKGVHSR